MRTRHLALASAVAGVLATASISKASLLAYEPFDYASGSAVTNSTSTDSDASGFSLSYYTGFSTYTNGTAIAGSQSLSPSDGSYAYSPIDNDLSLSGLASTTGLGIYKTFSSTVTSAMPSDTSPGTLYISFLMQQDSIASTEQSLMELMKNSTTSVVNVGFNGGQTTTGYFINSTGAGGGVTKGTGSESTATTLFVLQLNYAGTGQDSVNLYVNPAANPTPASAYLTSTGLTLGGSNAIDGVIFYSSAGDTNQFDEFRMGTTMADVLPEPGSIGMMAGLATAAMLRRRRRV